MSRYYVLETEADGVLSQLEITRKIYEGIRNGTDESFTNKAAAVKRMKGLEKFNPNVSLDVFTVERTKFNKE